MTEVIFTKNAGRFRKNQVVNFQPALADFFVSKVRCADFLKTASVEAGAEVTPSVDDFNDILATPSTPIETAKKTKRKKYGTRSAGSYSTRDLQAED